MKHDFVYLVHQLSTKKIISLNQKIQSEKQKKFTCHWLMWSLVILKGRFPGIHVVWRYSSETIMRIGRICSMVLQTGSK